MVLTLIAILALAVLGLLLLHRAEYDPTFLGVVGALFCIASGILLLVYIAYAQSWVAAKYKADIVNREYGTTYTQAEMFYAGEVIDVVRELDRKRYQVRIDKDTP